MELSAYEKQMLEGGHGEAKRIAMSVLYEMGCLFGAERMIPVTCAHIDGCSYAAVWDGGLEFAEKLAAAGGKVAVPTTLNITSRDIRCWRDFRNPVGFAKKCARMEQAYIGMGCIPSWTCAPYQYCGVIPSFGEHVAWAESNAVNYVNSVIGARSERYGDLVDICCAIAGHVPELGLHITENRAGTLLFDFSKVDPAWWNDTSAYAAAGYFVGNAANNEVPVLDNIKASPNHEDLKALSAAAASSGPVGLFHVVGATPEAPTLTAALQGMQPKRITSVTMHDMETAFGQLTSASITDSAQVAVDLVVTGCPHLSYTEAVRLLGYMGDQPVCEGVAFWIQTNDTVYHMLQRTGVLEKLQALGVDFMRDGCLLNQPTGEAWGFKNIVTNSGKMAHYAPGNVGANVYFRCMEDLVRCAISGKVQIV